MRVIPVVKMSGTGNDFLMVDNRQRILKEGEAPLLARAACPRRISAGADGVILVEPASQAGHDFKMRIFNADGSEAEMCGNGSRCVAVFAQQIGAGSRAQRIETLAGSLNATVGPDGLFAKVQLSPPSKLEVRRGVDVLGRKCDLYCINTGVPHAIQFVADVAAVDIRATGAAIRYHEVFKPKGTNADFVQLVGQDTIRIRTYERGVEDETFACGTGATAAAIVAGLVHGYRSPVKVLTAGGSTLTIHFEQQGDAVSAPFLEGAVDTIYKGEFYWRQ
ncbi:MAG: diaminopimelate epimerase [Planctomycetota bacterium]|nr:diaminopimelate epimerase [Planctomycetota bacterium]